VCGIAGVLAVDGEFVATEPFVTRMREALVHRGPDGAATWIADDGRVGLGFRRLAIVDLSERAMQPMPNETGEIRLLFNGEIYNHLDLRAELERTGRHRFRTDHSDTETIVHAYEEWGIDCLKRLRGMFAIAVWDGRTRELWLARDRVGIKPLYWSAYGGRVAFASEVKALLRDPDLPRTVDAEALYHYLSFLTTPAPQTLFANVSKVPAGAWLRVDERGRVKQHTWWDAWDDVVPLPGIDADEAAERVLAELRRSVELRKMSDVPVGVFLSGGIDSSTNAALFSEGEAKPVETFTIGYEGDNPSYPNELQWARRVADELGARGHERLLAQDELIEFLPRLARQLDEPIADPVAVPLYFLSQLAREQGVTVCHAGEGADELFYGYPSWRILHGLQLADGLPVPRGVKRAGLLGLQAAGRANGRPYEYLRRGAAGEPVFWGGAEAFTDTQKQQLLGPALRGELAGLSSWEALAPIRRRFEQSAWERSDLHWMTYLDLRLRLPELLLARIDRMSMAVGLEVRVPFLDHRLVELVLGLPAALQTRTPELKRILKLAVRDVLPRDVLERPKQGFRVPVDEWFLDRLGDRARAEVGSFCRESGLLDESECLRLLERPRREAWYLLSLALWWRELVA
jgi:asparagine synthase (glutamine-hydrolysing)